MYSFSNILITLVAANCFQSRCLFNQCKITVLSVHQVTDLTLKRFSTDFTFWIKFEAMCAETSSSLGVVRLFLEIQDLLTTNPWFLIDIL